MANTLINAVEALPPLRDVISAHDLRATKKLGQNFLLDLNLTQKIARAAGDLTGVNVFEIGPGPGGLTRAILLQHDVASLTALEFDTRVVAALQSLVAAASGKLNVMHQDALAADLTLLQPAPRAVVANLPYNIATMLLIGWLRQIAADNQAYQSLSLMFQREVAERLIAPPSSKAYGRLSVMTQWLCDCKKAFDLPPSAFTPPPKVVSSVMVLTPKTAPRPMPKFETMEKVVGAAFGNRRKMVRTTLAEFAGGFTAADIQPENRAENLSWQQFEALALWAESDNRIG